MKVKMFKHIENKYSNQTNTHTSQQTNNNKVVTKPNTNTTKKMEKTAKSANQMSKKRKKTFDCTDCSLEFGKKRELQEHRKSKHPRLERANTCGVCKRTFESENRLRMHLQFHNKGGEYVCFYCNKQFNKAWKLKIHLINHSGKAPFLCQFCGEDFLYPGKFVQHLKHMHDVGYACKECGDLLTQDGRTYRGPTYAGGTYMDSTYNNRGPGGTYGDSTNSGSTYSNHTSNESTYNGSANNSPINRHETDSHKYNNQTNKNNPTNRHQTDNHTYNNQTNNVSTNRCTNSPTYEFHRCRIYGCKDCVVFFATRSELVSHIENHTGITQSNDNDDLVIFDLKQERQVGTGFNLHEEEKQVGQDGTAPKLIQEQVLEANLSSNLRQKRVENASLSSNFNQNQVLEASLSANLIQEQSQVQRVQTRNLSPVSDLESDLVICDLKEEQLESPNLSPVEEDPLKIDEVNSYKNSDEKFGSTVVGVDTNERPIVVCDGVLEGVMENPDELPTKSGTPCGAGERANIRFITFGEDMNNEKFSTQNQLFVDDIFQCKENGAKLYTRACANACTHTRHEKMSQQQTHTQTQLQTSTHAHTQPQQMDTDARAHVIYLGQATHINAQTRGKTFQSVLNSSVQERERNRMRERDSVRQRNRMRERDSVRQRNRMRDRERNSERESVRERGRERESVRERDRETETQLPVIIRFLKEGNLTNKQQTHTQTNNNNNETCLQHVSNNTNIGSVSFESWLESTQNFDQDYVFGIESKIESKIPQNSTDFEPKILKKSSDFESNCVNNLLEFESICVNNSCGFLASNISRNVSNSKSNNVSSNVSNNSFSNNFFKQTNKNKIFSLKENAEMTFEDLCQF